MIMGVLKVLDGKKNVDAKCSTTILHAVADIDVWLSGNPASAGAVSVSSCISAGLADEDVE